jgi:hypothetical protein
VDALKDKVIKDFQIFLLQLNRGYKTEYSNILDSIMLIENYSDLNLPHLDYIYEYLMNK